MKKVLLVAFVAGLAMTSCKKDYTCKCVDSTGAELITYTAEMKKKDAETWCNNWNSAVAAGGDGDKCTLH
jgi:hypothetical protein